MQSIIVSTFAPFPSISLSLPSSTPISSLSYILSPLCSPQLQSVSTHDNKAISPVSTATIASLQDTQCSDSEPLSTPLYLRLSVKLPGGKGGFASQLRAQGGRMSSNKATNNDSCRDLNGRRLSTIKEAQKLATYIQAAPEREKAQKEQAQAKLEALNLEIARLSGEGPGGSSAHKRRLDDHEFVEESREIVEGVKDAVKLAMMKKRRKNKEKENKAVNEPESPPESVPAASSSKAAAIDATVDEVPENVSADAATEAVETEVAVEETAEVEEEEVVESKPTKGKGKAKAVKGKGKK